MQVAVYLSLILSLMPFVSNFPDSDNEMCQVVNFAFIHSTSSSSECEKVKN